MKECVLSEEFFSKEFEDSTKESIEYLLFLEWVKGLILITQSLNKSLDEWYQASFYIHIIGLFEVISRETSITSRTDSYTTRVKGCVEEMYSLITDAEYLYLEYCRHSVVHPLQNGYDMYQADGKARKYNKPLLIRGRKVDTSPIDVVKTIDEIIYQYGNDEDSFFQVVLSKLTPSILKMRDGLYESFLEICKEFNWSQENKIFKKAVDFMAS